MAAAQRLRQGIRALFAFTQPVDYTLAVGYLSQQQYELFRQMRRSEQLHSLNVLRSVLQQGRTPDDLAVAALLHDVGKSCYPTAIWQKTLAVLVRTFAPGLYSDWSQGSPRSLWKRAFVVAEQHPQWGAELAQQVKTSERAVWLITHHADRLSRWKNHPHYNLLKRLQESDDAN